VAYSYLALAIGMSLLVRFAIHSWTLYRQQVLMLILGALLPWMANAVYLLWPGFPFPLDHTVFAFTATAIVAFLALWRFRVFDIVPVARASAFESMEDAVLVLDGQGRLVDLNPAALNLIGRQAKEVIGQSVEQAFGEYGPLVERHCRSPEASSQLVLGSGEAHRFFDLQVSRVRDTRGRISGQLVALRDVTLRVCAEEALRASEERQRALATEARANEALYRTLIETSPDAIIVTDREALIIIANRRAVDLYGCASAEELVGRDAITFIAPEERQHAVAEWRKVLERGSVHHLDLTLVRQKGPRVPIEVSASAITDHRGQPAGLICVARDISERKRTQEALQQAHDELELRVQERTAELAQANLDLQHEISEHKRTEEQLRQAHHAHRDRHRCGHVHRGAGAHF
jgi:PAS domain S-box-containing protein